MSPLGELVRGQLAEWLRDKRSTLVRGRRQELAEPLRLLGLDDATLAAFAGAQRVVVSLPHASPNVFVPRIGVAWYARHLQDADPTLVHLRVPLTHVNFGDLGWRPYAWWFLDEAGGLVRETLFTRNKKTRHTVVAGRPPLASVPDRVGGVDRSAAELALRGTDRAASHMLIMAAIERAAGLAVPGRTVWVPLHLIVEFCRDAHLRPDAGDYQPWVDGLLGDGAGARVIDDTGRLAPTADPRQAFVLDNPSNIALLSLLGCAGVIGGAKMAGYWPDVLARTTLATERSGVVATAPRVLRLPEVDYAAVLPVSPGLAEALNAAGIRYSQGMALTEHADFAARIDPFTP